MAQTGRDIQVTVKGLDKFIEALPNIPHKQTMSDELNFAMKYCFEEAKRVVPVRTGFLKRSIEKRKESEFVRVVKASAGYAGFVEFGTPRMAPRSFMRRGAVKAKNYLEKQLAKELERAVK